MDIALALHHLVPSAEYRGSLNPRNRFDLVETQTENEDGEIVTISSLEDSGVAMSEQELYAAIVWLDSRSKPTWAQIQSIWQTIQGDVIWEQVRAQRNRLIAASDWTQLPDSPLTLQEKAAWASYRQALRDITEDFETPEDVEWPAQP